MVLAGLVIWGAQSYDSDLRKDNVLYASIARGVATGGHPLRLTWGNEPYLNKPPLFFLVTGLAIQALGPTVFAAKLPTILFGVGCLVLLYGLARRVSGDGQLAALAVWVAVLTYPLNRATNACRMESMVVFLMLLALRGWLDFRENGKPRCLALVGGSLGLAVLTKGPPALVAAAALAVFAVVLDRPVRGRQLAALGGALAGAVAIGGAYYAYMFRTCPAFAASFREQVVDRVGGGAQDGESPLFYAGNVLTYYLVFLPFCAIGLRRGWGLMRRSPAVRLHAVFVILTVAGIHLLSTKYMRYLYPVYLLAAIPTAAGLPRWLRTRGERALQVLTITAAVAMAVAPIPFLHQHHYARLAELNEMAAHSGLPVVVAPGFYADWESRSAALYFLDGFRRAAPPGPHFQVHRAPPPTAPGPLLLQTELVWVYAVVR